MFRLPALAGLALADALALAADLDFPFTFAHRRAWPAAILARASGESVRLPFFAPFDFLPRVRVVAGVESRPTIDISSAVKLSICSRILTAALSRGVGS